jgi:hypothetical protein
MEKRANIITLLSMVFLILVFFGMSIQLYLTQKRGYPDTVGRRDGPVRNETNPFNMG